jgi:hypothetical protein
LETVSGADIGAATDDTVTEARGAAAGRGGEDAERTDRKTP